MQSLSKLPADPYPGEGNGPYRLMRLFAIGPLLSLAASLRDPRAAQQARLRRILKDAAPSDFGRNHQLRPEMTLQEWREAVPIRRHAELLPWLDRVANGEKNVLFSAPVQQLLETSGTTGRPKWLPVTEAWSASVAAAQRLWVLGLLRDDEGLAEGKALSVVSPAVTHHSPAGIPIGSNTGRMFLAQPFWVRWRAPVPYPIYEITDSELRSYTILRHALTQPIRSWTSANPSTLLATCRNLRRWWEDLSADCADGSFCRGPAAALDASTRKRLAAGMQQKKLGPDPLPAKLWPLRILNCWKGGSAAFFLDRLPAAVGADLPVREVGITASEGFFAIPVDQGDPVAWLGGHVLEFVDDAGVAHYAWELLTGQEYRLVITTEAGLYRYDLEDRVRVTGWMGPLPRLAFVGKSGNVLSATGEKLTEEQLALACRQAFPGAVGASATLGWGEVPWLRVAVEGEAGSAEMLDAALQRINVEYASKRETGRLGLPELLPLPAGRIAAYKAARVAKGAPEAQVKDPWILNSENWQRLVEGEWSG